MSSILCNMAVRLFDRMLQERTNIVLVPLSQSTLQATKLYDLSTKEIAVCAVQCLGEPTCMFVTIDDIRTICTLYSVGSTVYNVTGLQLYSQQTFGHAPIHRNMLDGNTIQTFVYTNGFPSAGIIRNSWLRYLSLYII